MTAKCNVLIISICYTFTRSRYVCKRQSKLRVSVLHVVCSSELRLLQYVRLLLQRVKVRVQVELWLESKSSRRDMASLWLWYLGQLSKRPLLTQACSTGEFGGEE